MRFGKGNHLSNIIEGMVLHSVVLVLLVTFNPFQGSVWLSLLFSAIYAAIASGTVIGEITLLRMKIRGKDEKLVAKTRRKFLVFMCPGAIVDAILLCVAIWNKYL
ncbi:MAG: hypothetical protein FWC27_02335 [Firmicutes bacterium]|nr:hypothetical protein [Bacillota bacterium]